MVFEDGNNCVESIVNCLINGLQLNKIHVYGFTYNMSNLYAKPKIIRVQTLDEILYSDLVILFYEAKISQKDITWIQKNMKKTNILVYSMATDWDEGLCQITNSFCDISQFSNQVGKVYFIGPLFGNNVNYDIPTDFKVLAIVHVYNEVDVIAKTIEYLLSQDVDIYLIDNWSDDGSYEIMEEYAKRFNEKIILERFPVDGKKEYYDWYHQLERTEQLNRELDYNWFIHYDADEMRISPWMNTTLRQFIFHVDHMGYNLIDNTVIDFKLTNNNQTESIFMKDTWFDFGHRKGHFEQKKTWKKSEELDLKSSGGHLAVINYPKTFPLKVLNRHYPLRSIEQADKKIFRDRIPRFQKEKQERGWHGHYDKIVNGAEYIENSENLLLWDKETIQKYYIPLFFRIGIRRDFIEENWIVCNDYGLDKQERIVLYGAGHFGKMVYKKLVDKVQLVLWVDKDYKMMEAFQGEIIKNPEEIKMVDYDKIIISINNKKIVDNVKNFLVNIGVNQRSIIWEKIEVKKLEE